MPKITASFHDKPRTQAHRRRGAKIRVGTGGAHEGHGYAVAGWLTVVEAEVLAKELALAIAKARLAEQSRGPQPPTAGAAALPKAA